MPHIRSPRPPLQVLRRFLSVLGSFDWEHFCLALQGPLPLAQLHTSPRGEGLEPQLQMRMCKGALA